jgi:uncharacterized membrane protein HdeD (DUF308 family)
MIDLMKRSSTALIVFGVLATIFGLIAAFFPVATALTLVLLWGIYALVDGVTAAVLAFSGDALQSRGSLIFAAVVGIAAGLFAILQPVKSAVALAWVIGLWLLVRGVLELVGAFTNTDVQSRWLLALGGLLWMLGGILVISFPGVAALAISLWLGLLAIVWGIVLVWAGLHMRTTAKLSEPIPGEVV